MRDGSGDGTTLRAGGWLLLLRVYSCRREDDNHERQCE
jgi:hypothetical protein